MFTKTCSEYVILIAFPLQRWLRERVTMLRLYVLSVVVHVIYTTEFPLGDPNSRYTISPYSPDDRWTLQSFIFGKAKSKF